MTAPTSTDQDGRFAAALDDAQLLVGVVHGGGDADDVASILDHTDLPALCVALAALVPDDTTVTDLLAWYNRPPVIIRGRTWTHRQLRDAHSAYNRGIRTREVLAGESAYTVFNRARRKATA